MRFTTNTDTYTVVDRISGGSFGEVYHVQSLGGNSFALKLEQSSRRIKTLRIEYRILRKLGSLENFPKIHDVGHVKEGNFIVMELLGRTLNRFLTDSRFGVSIVEICLIAINCISAINAMHNSGFVHRDLKPDNILFGLKEPHRIYFIDFGFTKTYMNSQGEHIKKSLKSYFSGTIAFMSSNALQKSEHSRRDDMESLSLVFAKLYFNYLPWENFRPNSENEYAQMRLGCMQVFHNMLTSAPNCIRNFYLYSRSLEFEQTPDYSYCYHLFNNAIMFFKQASLPNSRTMN